ncbi:GLPGLI family protein [Flaviramulus sp. BrNp1-15]|uniref:GLPGLI family protein n=1 Tax=Flaviramulus sp. BrNp1-15 TaxID=2916754 RepID=UPI001EE8FCB5|nr:GLPGLI family protein [Flaviramulus sp. BrNp1-15]ULC59301.1 GLPGLI family protein [Flaviramulus sp. BrNp1-15]
MKINYVCFFLLLTISNAIAQEFQGIATYKSHRKVDLKISSKNENSEMKKQIQEQLRKQFQQEYTLTFNKNESIYKREEKLQTPQPAQSGFRIQIAQGSDIMYKNIKENRYTNKTEIFGKLFLIKDTLNNIEWQLVNETKNIGDYTCFKAVFNEEFTTQTLTEEGEIETVTKPRTTTLWYTPQIPINNGPAEYYGLPGLILEVNDGDLTLVCTKIIINPEERVSIEEPTKGKEVSQVEFEEIQDKKSKEMMEQYQSRKGNNDGNRVMIRIGG